jgi:hypothetical protein
MIDALCDMAGKVNTNEGVEWVHAFNYI